MRFESIVSLQARDSSSFGIPWLSNVAVKRSEKPENVGVPDGI
jgi:hypothetical protein